MVCTKEGTNKSRGKSPNYRPSGREGCNVVMSSTVQNDGQWKISKIHLQHCHEIDLDAVPLHLRQHLLELNDRSGIEEEKEQNKEEEERKPYDGQTFGNFAELVQFLFSYAKTVGFQWSIRTSRKDKNSGKTCGVCTICSKSKRRKGPNSQMEGCDVNLCSTLQKDGQWKINQIHLQHCHEMDPNATPILRRWHLLTLNGRLGIEEEEEGKEREEEEGETEKEAAGNSSLSNGIDVPSMNPPYDGQTFGSLQELIQYSCSYAKAVGFQWRKRTSRNENNGEICGINKISLQHSHEIDLNVRPFLRQRCRSIPPQVRYPLELNDRLSIEDEKEREAEEEEEEEGAVSVASEQSQDPSDDEVMTAFNLHFKCHCILIRKLNLKSHFPSRNVSPSINDAIMEEQPSFEGSFNQQDAIEEMGTTCRQSHNLAVNVEQHCKKLKRDMDTVMECN